MFKLNKNHVKKKKSEVEVKHERNVKKHESRGLFIYCICLLGLDRGEGSKAAAEHPLQGPFHVP